MKEIHFIGFAHDAISRRDFAMADGVKVEYTVLHSGTSFQNQESHPFSVCSASFGTLTLMRFEDPVLARMTKPTKKALRMKAIDARV